MDKQVLEIRLFGPLQIAIAGKPVTGLVSAKARALLAYLASQRQPSPRGKIAGLLWSDYSEKDARRNLRVEISKLRQCLDPYLLFTRQEAMLRPDAAVWTDLQEFESLQLALHKGGVRPTIQQLVRGMELYQADFLGGLQVRGAPLFEEWLLLEREWLRQAAVDLLDRLVEAAVQQQDWETGLRAARKALTIDNWREESHRQLIHLLALSGDRSAALAQFEAARRILVQELGIEPGPETFALYHRIRAGEVTSPAAPGPADKPAAPPLLHNLPAPTTSFVGRETELEQLGELFIKPDCRLVTLTGAGGTGKTRLAVEFCWRLVDADAAPFKDGIYVIPLAAVQDGAILHAVIVDALKLPGSPDPRQQLIQYVRDRHMLLVLDNFEHLADSAPDLVEILHSAPGLRLIVTSRHLLHLYEEWVFPVAGMPYPQHGDLAGWQNYAAVQLFEQRARRVNLRFSAEDQRACIIRLCQLLEGLPLGIELASAWVHVLPCSNIVQLIEANLSLPEQQIRNLPSRQRSLQAVFQYSWDLLSPEEQGGLARLTVFHAGFTVQAAESVAETPPRLLANLAAKSLLRFSPDGRYELHSLLRSFAFEKLPSVSARAAQAAHSRYYAGFLTRCAQGFSGPGETQAVEAIASEIGNIRAGWQWALAQIPGAPTAAAEPACEAEIELLAQYIPILSIFYFRKSWFREAEPVLAQAVNAMQAAGFDSLPPATRAPFVLGSACQGQARHSRALGQNAAARDQISNSLQLLTLYGETPELADAWHILGQIEQQTGSLSAAEEAYRHSLRIYRALEHLTGIASNLISLGVLAKNRGDLSQAASLYTECQHIFEQRSDQRGIWTCLINLGNIANVQQDYQAARRLYEQAYQNVQQAGDHSRQALTLVNLGSIAREVNEASTAVEHYQESLRLSQEIGEIRIQVASLDGLGKTCLNKGDFRPAADYLLQAMRIALKANLLPQALDSLAAFGRLAAQRGQPERASAILAHLLANPSCPDHVRRYAQEELDRIKTLLPGEVIAQAAQEFQGLSLDAAIDRL